MSNLSGSNLSNVSEREQFAQQLEMLAETNRRLGESNDDLRNALSVSEIVDCPDLRNAFPVIKVFFK